MGEENNILGIVDNGTGIINMPYRYNDLIDRYEIKRPDVETVSNTKNELVVPEVFEKVLKKNMDGLNKIKIESYEKIKMFDPATFNPNYRYVVNLILIFSWDSCYPANSSKLEEVVNNSFSVMYSDNNNFKFRVIRLTTEERDFDKEFFEFFLKKK